jgi:hypothetical protein
MNGPPKTRTRATSWGFALLAGAAVSLAIAGPPTSKPPAAPASTQKQPSDCVKQCAATACSGKPISCRAAIATLRQCLPQCQSGSGGSGQPAVSTSSQGECTSVCSNHTPDGQPPNKTWTQHCTLACTPAGVPPNTTVIWLGR